MKKGNLSTGKQSLCPECDSPLTALAAISEESSLLTYHIVCCVACQTAETPSAYRLVHLGNFCPHCRFKRMNISATLVRLPTHIRNGEIRMVHQCSKCQYQDFDPLTLPLLAYNHEPTSNSKRIGPLSV